MDISAGFVSGVVIVTIALTIVGVFAARKIKSSEDFSIGGRKASAILVAGTMTTSCVGGGATIATAQMAFRYGLDAWWYTLGMGIGCAVLGLLLAGKLYESKVETVPQFLVGTYGPAVGPISSIFSSVAIFLSIVTQALSFVALMISLFPLNALTAVIIGVILVLLYVVFGGVWSTGMVGVLKLILLYAAMIACGLLAYLKLGGLSGAHVVFPNYPWFSLFGRGVGADLAAGFSMAVGILVTQIYVQAILSGRSLRAARGGACLAALFTIPIGLLGVAVGLFMKAHFPKTPSAAVLPTFIMNFMPPVVAGIFIAALLISIVGSWAGLTLGVSTMLTRDIYRKFIRPASTDKETLFVLRLVIFVLCAIVCLTTYGNRGSLIMAWGFLSFGLRTCVVLIPMLAAMYCKRWITPAAGVAAVLCGPLLNIVWKLAFPKGMDPVYPGLIGAVAALVVVSLVTHRYPLKATVAHSAK